MHMMMNSLEGGMAGTNDMKQRTIGVKGQRPRGADGLPTRSLGTHTHTKLCLLSLSRLDGCPTPHHGTRSISPGKCARLGDDKLLCAARPLRGLRNGAAQIVEANTQRLRMRNM